LTLKLRRLATEPATENMPLSAKSGAESNPKNSSYLENSRRGLQTGSSPFPSVLTKTRINFIDSSRLRWRHRSTVSLRSE